MVTQDFVRNGWCLQESHRVVYPKDDAFGHLGRCVANEREARRFSKKETRDVQLEPAKFFRVEHGNAILNWEYLEGNWQTQVDSHQRSMPVIV
jgi:hypothetical protein